MDMAKGEIKMPTKTLEREETLPANSLRTLSQKSLVEMVDNFEKLGLIVNNELSIAMMDWKKYERIVDLIQEQEEMILNLTNMFEDVELAVKYGEKVIRAEKGESKSYEINSAEELFNMLD